MSAHLLVLGGGAAGMSAAVAAAEAGLEVTLADAADLSSSASVQAQGGLAAVTPAGVAAGDSVASHVADTLCAGACHGDAAVVAALCSAAAEHVATLTRWGTVWDRDASGAVSLTREAAHAHRRILHVGGDATGAGIVAALRDRIGALARQGRIRLLTGTRATSLLLRDGVVTGARLTSSVGDSTLSADAVLLASGGISGAYGVRTSRWANPGDAVALGLGAGALVADAELVQFHPTHCAQAGFMISEAVRGEGAVLRDAAGTRFMTDLDPRAELAPRDVVSRGVFSAEGGAWLDAAPIVAREGTGFLARRFPTITAALATAGLDLERDPVPVTPAEHYWMGGIAADAASRCTVPGLLVAGEAARSGLHGANRLASNSLLEAVHMGLAAVATVRAGLHVAAGDVDLGSVYGGEPVRMDLPAATDAAAPSPTEVVDEVRRLADTHLGVRRTGDGIATALSALERLQPAAGAAPELVAARALATAALTRTDSLGAHVRDDGDASVSRPGLTVALTGHARAGAGHTPSGLSEPTRTLQEA